MAQETGRQDSGAEGRTGRVRQDALELLRQEHREVEALLERCKASADATEKLSLARRACLLWKAHSRIEEEIFYPAARRRIEDKELVEEALTEHRSIFDLIGQVELLQPGDPLAEARIQALSERIDAHVREEESELFPEVQRAEIDLMGLGARLAELEGEALRELGLDRAAAPSEPRAFDRER
jgi:hypothetical protein